MNIHTLQLHNFRRFADDTFRFHPQFTILIGNNGFGKTTILDALSIMMSAYLVEFHARWERTILPEEVRLQIYEKTDGVPVREPQYPVHLYITGTLHGESVQWKQSIRQREHAGLPIREVEEILVHSRRDQQSVQDGEDINLPFLGYYGPGRVWPKNGHVEIEKPGSRTLGYENCLDPSSDQRLFAKWFKQLELSAVQRHTRIGVLESVREAVKTCIPGARHFFYDAMTDELMIALEQENYCLFNNLSDGYRNMVAMVADIAHRVARLNPHLGADAAGETSGVVLIDEIDLHLHPQWQRRVVGDLQRAFPQIQFIATTHSPFILQSLAPGEVIDLNQGDLRGSGVRVTEAIRAEPPPEAEYSNKSIEDITEEVMGVEVPQRSRRYQAMFDAAKRYYALLEQGKDVDPQEKQRIKTRLDELSSPFSDNVAYHAFLEMERMAAGLGKSEKEDR